MTNRSPRKMLVDEQETDRLLELASDGDTSCWGELLTRSMGRLSRLIALRLDPRLRGRLDADDVIQEIYIEAWRHLPEYRKHRTIPFYLWLRGLAQNKLFELHRRHLATRMRDAKREVRHGFACNDSTSSVLGAILLASHTSPSGTAMHNEISSRLQGALESMDEIDREVLMLRHFEQLSPTETALVLGIQEKAAGMRYVRAIKRLREILTKLPGGLSGFRL